ncbi:hypothetical protein [Vibrio owensii]|uniref:ParE family toxin-like protein n=1 Tax=Vibrio owensii TaxID=696485 RepID=UPI001A7EBEC3|nr:hypothetical protein [Vibrio owensii]
MFEVEGRIPEKIINKAIGALKNKRPRLSTNHRYKIIDVTPNYRLINRGLGYVLMTHQRYNRVVGKRA